MIIFFTFGELLLILLCILLPIIGVGIQFMELLQKFSEHSLLLTIIFVVIFIIGGILYCIFGNDEMKYKLKMAIPMCLTFPFVGITFLTITLPNICNNFFSGHIFTAVFWILAGLFLFTINLGTTYVATFGIFGAVSDSDERHIVTVVIETIIAVAINLYIVL